jgi:hypothetical protein
MITIKKTGIRPHTYKLYVSRSGSRFCLFVVKDGSLTEVVTAKCSELLHDYLQSEWPVGTKVNWFIL